MCGISWRVSRRQSLDEGNRHGLKDLTDIPYPNDKLYESILNSDFGKARLIAKRFSNKIRGAE